MQHRRLIAMAAAAGLYALASACSESLPEGHACPVLCPNQNIPVHDTVLDGLTAIVVDTTVVGYPLLGTEPELLVATSDSVDVRAAIRFDSVPFLFRPSPSDTLRPTARVFCPYLRLVFDSTTIRPRGNAAAGQISVYDIDTAGTDTSVAVLSSLFRPDRFLGAATIVPTIDSVRIGLDTARIRAHVAGDHLIRLGLRLSGAVGGAFTGRVAILNAGSGTPPVFSYAADTDTVHVAPFTSVPRSTSPRSDSTLLNRLRAYPIIVQGSSPPLGERLDIGGMPARRVYVRFAIPSRIIDSATVIRATLTLTLVPGGLRGFFSAPPDTLKLLPQALVSAPTVEDPTRAAGFLAPAAVVPIDTSRAVAALGDSVNIEFATAVRHWSRRAIDTVARAIVIQAFDEGATPLQTSFFPALPSVPAAQRPHVHLSYIPRVGFGLP